MSHLSRSQILVYAAIAVAVLLVGARWIRSADAAGTAQGPVRELSGGGGGGKSISVSGPDGSLVIHVAGAVREPGVYRLPEGSRVTDAVKRAGGATPGAGVDSINLAAQLSDGQQIVVPEKPSSAPGETTAAAHSGGPISLGSATAEELETIEGIGPVTAQSIIDFRTENGGVSSVDDLDQVSGIGPATMEALRGRLQP